MSLLEPLQECFAIGLCASFAFNFLFNWNSLVFFLIHVLCWFLSDYTLLTTAQNSKLPFTKFEFVVSWMYRETICLYLFIQAAINPTVQWRHGVYRLKWGGLAEEISKTKPDTITKTINNKHEQNVNKSGSTKKFPVHHYKSKSFSASLIYDREVREPLLQQQQQKAILPSSPNAHSIQEV